MPTEEVKVIYKADVDQYNRSLGEAVMATDKYSQTLDNLAGGIAKFGIATSRMMLNNPLTKKQGLGPATESAAAYEQQLSLLGARAKLAGQNMSQLGKDVRAVARDFPIGMGGAVQQFEALQRAGKSGDELKKMTVAMTNLGAATGELGPALTQAQVQFSRTFKQFTPEGVEKLNDSVATLSSTFGTSASSILDFSNAVAPIGKTLGMSSTDILGFSTAFGRAGEDGYRAANVFNKVLSDMERTVRTGSPQIRAYAETVGMTSEQFRMLAESDPTEAVTRFMETIGTKGSDGIRILEELGLEGARTQKAITSVAESGDIREMVKKANAAYGSGSSTEAAEEAFNGLNDSITKTNESLQQLVESSAKPYVGIMGEVADKTATVTSGFASLAQSDAVQTLMTIGAIAGIGGKATGMFMQGGMISQMAKGGLRAGMPTIDRMMASPAGQWAQDPRNRGMIRMAGMGGMAMGMMSGNNTMMALGTLGLLASQFGGTSGPMRIFRQGIGRGLDTFYGGAGGSERFRDIRQGAAAPRRGFLYDRARALEYWKADIRPEDRMANRVGGRMGGFGGQWTRMDVDIANAQVEDRVKQLEKGTAAQQRSLLLRRGTAAAGQTALAGASMLSGMVGAIGLPMLAIGGAAAIGGGLYMSNKAKERASEDESAISKIGQAAGIATLGLEQFTESLEKVTKSAHSTADAMEVSTKEMEVVTSEEYKAAWEVEGGLSDVKLVERLTALGANQSPQMQNQLIMDVAARYSEETAERVGKLAFGQNAAGSPLAVTTAIRQETMANPWQDFTNAMFSNYAGKDDVINYIESAAENTRAEFDSRMKSYGAASAYEFAEKEVAPEVFQQIEAMETKRGAQRWHDLGNVFNQQTKLTNADEAEELLQALPGMTEDKAKEAINKFYGDWNTTGWTEGHEGVSFEEYVRTETEWGKEYEKNLLAAEGKTKSNLEMLTETAEVWGGKELSDAIGKAQEAGGTTADMLNQYDEIIQAQKQVAAKDFAGMTEEEIAEVKATAAKPLPLTASEALQLRAYGQPENIGAQASAQFASQQAAMNFLGGRAGEQIDFKSIGDSIEALKNLRETEGEIDAATVQVATRGYEAMQGAIGLQTGGTLSITEGRHARQQLANQVTSQMERTEKGEYIFSENEDLAKIQMEAVQTEMTTYQENAQLQRSFLEADRQRQRQQQYAEEDYGRSAGYARADFAINRARTMESYHRNTARAEADFNKQRQRANEDYYRQQGYAEADFQKQTKRSTDDFHKQMTRSEADFYRQREYQLADFHRQQGYQTEDFNKSMKRASEEMARTMLDPMERIGAKRNWSAGGLAANLAEQNEAVRKQLETLDQLREKGLSQDVIDMLGLAQAGNAAQTNALAGISEEDIARLNAQAQERYALGGQISEEQVSSRQAREDFAISQARAWEELQISMARSMEEFNLSVARANEDFSISMARSTEDFATQTARSFEEFQRSLARSEEDFDLSMARQHEDLMISLAQQEEDLNRSLARQWEAITISATRAKDQLRDSFREISMTDAEREQAFAQAWGGEFTGYENFMIDRVDVTAQATGNIAAEGLEDVSNIAGGAQGDLADTTDEAAGDLNETKGQVKGVTDSFSRGTVTNIGDVKAAAQTAIDSIKGVSLAAKTATDDIYKNAMTNIPKLSTAAMDSITETAKKVPDKIKDSMKEFAWLLDEKNHMPSGAGREIIIKTDEANFKKTWEKLVSGGGGGGPSGGGPPSDWHGGGAYYVTGGKGVVSQQWGVPNARYAAGRHTGIDISAPQGTPLYATFNGTVAESRMDKSYGNMVMVDNGAGVQMLYGHMIQRHVAAGDKVIRGTNIGKVGSTGNSTGPHVHAEARKAPYKYGNDINPVPYLAQGAIIRGLTNAVLGEGGPESVIPLDSRGARFLTEVLSRYSATTDAKAANTAQYGVSHTSHVTSIHNDSSVHTGDVTVVASDPEQMYTELRRKQARARLATRV